MAAGSGLSVSFDGSTTVENMRHPRVAQRPDAEKDSSCRDHRSWLQRPGQGRNQARVQEQTSPTRLHVGQNIAIDCRTIPLEGNDFPRPPVTRPTKTLLLS